MATVSPRGLQLIKAFEGLRLEAYRDPVSIWTIGYGHTGSDVTEGLRITTEQAEELLRRDLARFEQGVQNALWRPATQGEFDAMVSLAFNVGMNAFRSSTLLRLFNESKREDTARQFGEWVLAGGKVLRGLVRRRMAEVVVFLT